MSIALSVVLHPSKKLQILAILFSACLFLIGVYFASCATLPLYLRLFLLSCCLLASLVNYLINKRNAKLTRTVLISGQGDLRIISGQTGSTPKSSDNQIYVMSPGTVLWPRLLVLRLRRLEDDNMINLMVPFDAVSQDEFRRLSIACRWIVAQADLDLK